jgi:hypothetical protein
MTGSKRESEREGLSGWQTAWRRLSLSLGESSGEQNMMAYEFYWRDKKGRDHLIGILPERRKNPERITQESVMNWGRKVIGYNKDVKKIFCTKVDIDEAQVTSWGLIPLSELRTRKED